MEMVNLFDDAAESMLQSFEDAEAAGIDINYQPEVMADTTKQTNEEWQAQMKEGIGSSSAGAFTGVDGFKDITVAVLEKEGVLPPEEIDADKQLIFDVGHVMEDPLLRYFSSKTGMKVYTDRNRYRHPLYPFMFDDLDGVGIDQLDRRFVIEVKTVGASEFYRWKTGTVGIDGCVCVAPTKEAQMIHHLAVNNLDYGIWIIMNSENLRDEIKFIRYNRNYKKEKLLIDVEKEVWEGYIEKAKETGKELFPESPTYSDRSYDRQRSRFSTDSSNIKEIDSDEIQAAAKEMIEIKDQKALMNKELKKLKEREHKLQLDIIPALDGCSTGLIPVENDQEKSYLVSYKSPKDKVKVDLDNLSIKEPKVYEALVNEGYITYEKQEPRFSIVEKAVKKG